MIQEARAMSEQNPEKIAVIGAGLGGISAAISLAQRGYRVEVYEKNPRIGGKLNVLRAQGYSFDLGPSILTLPHVFERLFADSGKSMADYLAIRPLRPHWRNVFADGTVLDLYPEPEKMAEQARRVGEPPDNVTRFLDYAADLYDLVDRGYFQEGLDTATEFRNFYGLRAFPKFDLLRSMHRGVTKRLASEHLRAVFDFFIKYVGSSPYRAPAFMNCLPTIQFRYDLWYADGGMYAIAEALGRLMDELGVTVHLETEVARLTTDGDRVTGLVLRDGTTITADIVVSNMEVIPAYRDLLHEAPAFMRSLRRFEPACSGLILDLGLDREYPQLAHHNIFHSSNPREHFRSVFRKKELPSDPTVYLVAASKTDPTVAPPGCDCLKILPHIPHIDDENPLTDDDYAGFRDKILDKLERMGLTDLRKHITFEHMWTPHDIRREYYSNKGAIYGVVSDRYRNLAFKAPKKSSRYANLFFTGGSVNPGAGMPMVVLCGQNVARTIARVYGAEPSPAWQPPAGH